MKRTLDLVSYESSEDEDTSRSRPTPKRKLPKVSSSLTIQIPPSDPKKHQGRIRSTPHVEGQFAAFVYIPVAFSANPKLFNLLLKAIDKAYEVTPEIMCDWKDNENENYELHISLTHPIYLRHHQREELKRAVKQIALSSHPFTASFSTFTSFSNDECTRTFLSVEVGAGHNEMKSLSKALLPMLNGFRQKEYYDQPRFHASIAWALLNSFSSSTIEETPSEPAYQLSTREQGMKTKVAKAIDAFPENLVPDLNAMFKQELASSVVGTFDVEQLCIRIGKEKSSWNLTGK